MTGAPCPALPRPKAADGAGAGKTEDDPTGTPAEVYNIL